MQYQKEKNSLKVQLHTAGKTEKKVYLKIQGGISKTIETHFYFTPDIFTNVNLSKISPNFAVYKDNLCRSDYIQEWKWPAYVKQNV